MSSQSSHDSQSHHEKFSKRPRRRHWRFFLVVAAGIAAVVYLPSAFAHGRWGHGHGGEPSAEKIQERIESRIDHILGRIDATDAQIEATHDILSTVVPRMVALRKQGKVIRTQLTAALGAPEVDADEVERIRKTGIELAGKLSEVGSEALIGVAAILDAEQRAKLIEHWESRH